MPRPLSVAQILGVHGDSTVHYNSQYEKSYIAYVFTHFRHFITIALARI